jgi:hypothetical protein
MTVLKFSLIILLFSLNTATAQDFRLGMVSKQELLEKAHPADTSAPAAYLYKKGRTYFTLNGGQFLMNTEVECRIKIYNSKGYEYATEEVSFYSGGKSVKVSFNDAYTYNLVGGNIEKTKLKSDGEFQEQIRENYTVKKITMPNVKPGSVIEYKYTIATPYFTTLRDWYFQYSIPANYVVYEVGTPRDFLFNRYLSGYINVDKSAVKVRTALGGGFEETVVTFSIKNVKALKSESHVNNIENYMPILKHELALVTYPNGSTEHFSSDWPSVAKKIYEDEDFGRELGYTSYFEEDLKALLVPGLSRKDKVTTIFNYVKSRMNWNKDLGYYCVEGVKKAYAAKVGNTAEINLMLTAMLRYAELDANPVLISTRSNGVAIYPTRAAYNYVIASVNLDNTTLLLDATSKNTLPDIIPLKALNWVGRMIKKNGATAEIDLMPKTNSKEIINIIATIDNTGGISGKARDQYYDYNAFIFRENYLGMTKDSYVENLEKQYDGAEISGYTITNDKDILKPVIEEYNYTHNGLVDVIGSKMYLNPMLMYTRTENPFKAETREYPIDFVYPHQDKYMINITIPEGYVIESLPSPLSMAMIDNAGSFKFNIASPNANQIQITAILDINYAILSQEYYKAIKDFYQKMVEKNTEKIILAKKA